MSLSSLPKMANTIENVRQQFPALTPLNISPVPIYFDGPGGTQIPQSVIDAVGNYYRQGNSNLGGDFLASQKTVALVQSARERIASLVGAAASENIVFGANMTTLTLHFSRSISQSWQAGDNIILSESDHGGNRSAWESIAIERGVKIRYLPIKDHQCALNLQVLDSLINEKTKLVAVTAASNVTGTLTDLEYIISAAKKVGALTYIDAVHLLPHQRVNVSQLDCDFLAGSVYKFFGPHLGFVYGKSHHLENLTPYKVFPAPTYAPSCWETGTLNFEALAGAIAAVDYIASLGEGRTLDSQLDDAYVNIIAYEQYLTQLWLEKLSAIRGITLYGIPNADLCLRTPTFALSFEGRTPKEVARVLGGKNICTWSGHLYADKLIDALSLSNSGGILRVGLTHYNTVEEVDRFFDELSRIVGS
jgi:cysteine desulfurase family protein (TIGR01976 family)